MKYGLLTLVAAVQVATGCAINAPATRAGEALDSGSAYVYGRFTVKAMPSAVGEEARPASQTVGLLIGCDDGSTYPIYFSPERAVRVVKFRPATCALKEIRYVDDWKIVLGRKPPPSDWGRSGYFAAGHGYYLGDFSAVAKHEIEPGFYSAKEIFSWDLDPVEGQFAETTAEFRKNFVMLSAMPIHDQRLAPDRPALKRGLAGASEPTMSPERISRLAELVKTTFRTPAACTAACPKGDCLPYRAPSGAALTCINHCMTSGDCPTGMVCNCSSRPGTDCQPVATSPGDPMDGICMPVATPTVPSVP